ncbi:cytochrome b [Pseudoalteromonas spongiae]|uniref:cytochrome b n=1 Tax=Pseudoalteromonas spongiae TaxID=298657 RepID=UPI00026CCD6A|nr:cytochrome b [Pseudoalteromonas spongiae]ATD01095.1 cytochrome b561 [Pseudoalteromonas spongiae UST010723-006]
MNIPSLNRTTRYFHWLSAFIMLGLISVGYYMVYWEVWALYPTHKSIGVLALLVVLPRALYRLQKGLLTPTSAVSHHQQKLIEAAHWALLAGTILMPISGMLYSGFGGYGIDIFGFTLVASNYIDSAAVPYNETIFILAKAAHSYIAYGLTGLIALHILGAFKHHLLSKDVTLLRMLGRA